MGLIVRPALAAEIPVFFPGWEDGGGFLALSGELVVGRLGYAVRLGEWWVHSFLTLPGYPLAACRLVQACRQRCRADGFAEAVFQVVPEASGSEMLRLLRLPRARLELAQIRFEV